MKTTVKAKKGRVEIEVTDDNVKLALARDEERIYSRPGAGWVDLTPAAAREIAEALFVSENTVKAHMRHAMEKLHTHSRQGAVSLLFRKIELDSQDTGENSAKVHY